MSKKLGVTINGVAGELAPGRLIKSLIKAGHKVPHMCWHPDIIQSGGRCRVCVCKVDGKVVPSCTVDVKAGSNIDTTSAEVQELQHAALALEKSNMSPETATMPLNPATKFIIRKPELCIHCNLCVDMCKIVQGVGAIGDMRKELHGDNEAQMSVGTFHNCPLTESECVSCGQCINVCPTGALEEASEIDIVMDAMEDESKVKVVQFAPAVRLALAEEFGCAPGERNLAHEMVTATRMLGKNVKVFDVNFTADLTIIEEGFELLERLRRVLTGEKKLGGDHMPTALPMITSCSPGWVLFCEKNYHDLLDNLSTCKSPQQMSGALTKHYYAQKIGVEPKDIASISIMPCVAKKAEKTRPEFATNGIPDIDNVLTTREFAKLLKQRGIDPTKLKPENFDEPFGMSTGAGLIFGATGGVMEAALRTVWCVVTGRDVPFKHLDIAPVRGMEGIKEAGLTFTDVLPEYKFLEGVTAKVAVCHGTANARKLMDRLRECREAGHDMPYHFIEVMACPGGCLGGGGQPKPTSQAIKMERMKLIYAGDSDAPMRKSHENPAIKNLYKEFLIEPLGHHSHHLLHTTYTAREAEASSFLALPEAKEMRTTVLKKYPTKLKSRVTNILCETVDKYGYIGDPAVAAIANHIGSTPVSLDAVISHYHYFPRTPQGKHTLYMCNCIHCRLHGSEAVMKSLDDMGIHYHKASWLGWCVNAAPAAMLKLVGDENVHHMVGLKPFDERFNALKEGNAEKLANGTLKSEFTVTPLSKSVPNAISVLQPIALRDADKAILAKGMCPVSNYAWSLPPEEIISRLKCATLRGCGGAGFPTHIKWAAVRGQPMDKPKYIVINADEGLPNTFKDFFLLNDPGCRMRMIVGMCLAAHTVGAKGAVMYLRFEYKNLKPVLEASFQKYLSLNPKMSKDFVFEVVLGGGPYICGEETALFESVEGNAPQARTERSIFPTQHGIFGVPTLVNNVETLAWIPTIVYNGSDAFTTHGGTQEQRGIKLISISGQVAKPTLVEVPMGSTVREILEQNAGIPVDEIAAVEVGGILENLLYPKDFDKRISLDGRDGTVPAGGSLVVFQKKGFNEENVYEEKCKFAEFESCQLCVPCREGTRNARHIFRALYEDKLDAKVRHEFVETVHAMETSSNCGHGKAAGKMFRVLMEDLDSRNECQKQA
eukprot:PhM_4_TR3251/c0_g1_i1/m.74594